MCKYFLRFHLLFYCVSTLTEIKYKPSCFISLLCVYEKTFSNWFTSRPCIRYSHQQNEKHIQQLFHTFESFERYFLFIFSLSFLKELKTGAFPIESRSSEGEWLLNIVLGPSTLILPSLLLFNSFISLFLSWLLIYFVSMIITMFDMKTMWSSCDE